MFFSLSVLLGSAKFMGELTRKIRQPAILGEIFAGILLGPTVLGHFRPQWYSWIFPTTGALPIVLETVATLGVVFFLLVAGLETSLRLIFRRGKSALFVSSFGVIFPFVIGFIAARSFPHFLGLPPRANSLIFALFVGTALSISALPVIARTLMDLGLLREEMGTVVISSAMFDDLVGWILFGVVLNSLGSNRGPTVLHTLVLVALFVLMTLTVGRWLLAKVIRSLQSHASGRGALLGMIFTLTLAAAGFAEYSGFHALFGAFVIAIAIGDSLDSAVAGDIRQIVANVFAPFFFCSICLRTNFVTNFRLGMTLSLLMVASVGKVLGATWGARLGGMDVRSSWAVGVAMNARGAMEVILGSLALRAGLIGEPMFVSLVVMALVTSLIAGPLIQALMKSKISETGCASPA
jgi:Kef-type K+ transport system membrane component KefB